MRKWHRWLSVVFGAFLLWIAATGMLSHIAAWTAPAPQMAPADFVCPETMICRPKPVGTNWVSLFHHLHSGEPLGPVGELASFLSGLALLFFAGSGLWMYIQMWRNRKARGLKNGWFWN